jgi:hypothetical protein
VVTDLLAEMASLHNNSSHIQDLKHQAAMWGTTEYKKSQVEFMKYASNFQQTLQ